MNLLAARAVRSPIGLDVGARAIKAAQVVRSGAGFRLVASVSLARLEAGPALSAADAARLGPALVRAGFRGRTLAAALPPELALHTNADLPARASKSAMDEIAASELARVGRASPDALVCAYWPTGDPGAGETCPSRVVGAEQRQLDALLDSLAAVQACGGRVMPLALDTSPWAQARCLAPWLGESQDVAVIADVGWRRCALTIVQGQRIIYERIAAVGLESLREAMGRDLAAPPEAIDRLLQRLDDGSAPGAGAEIARLAIRRQGEQLAQEVERSLRFAAERGADGEFRVILCGGGASRALAEALRSPLDGLAEVRRATPDQFVSGAGGAAADDPGLICAIGLAMRMDR